MSKAFLAVSMAIVTAAIIVGCGGGDDTNDSSTATLSKAEFIKEADAICADADEQGQEEAEEFAKENDFSLEKPTDEQLEEAISAILVPSLNQQAEEISALGAPEGDEEQIEALTASLEDVAGEIEDDPGIVINGEALTEPSELAEDYGLKVCGAE
ncbi:MAG TPA: hypothetical protein VG458_10220 [Solirubrobacterales bacterium]|nr:hypothetical protein [Solirubrobacterales bacterium]